MWAEIESLRWLMQIVQRSAKRRNAQHVFLSDMTLTSPCGARRRAPGRGRAAGGPHTYAKQPMHAQPPSMSARADFAKKRAAARGWA
jgi:hypothetical protein